MGDIQVTDFQAKVLNLWDKGMDTHRIAQEITQIEKRPIHESHVYRALNAARVERRVYAESEAS